ncbi:MAG: efflux RND transporter periplasmic adaptor subunit [Fibrobacteres bacterium]|nr:efflux RND transporter periplasmic adaptor subunit [Fibrobacterota bacterium]
MKQRRKSVLRLYLLVLAAAFSGLVLMACGSKSDKPARRTDKVERQDIRDALTLSGVLEAEEEVSLKSEVSGQIKRLRVEEGDFVRKGDTLIEIDPEQLLNRRVRDQLSLSRSRILNAQAQRNAALAESLRAVEGISPQKIQDQQWQAQLTHIQVRQDSLALRETEIQLSKTAVIAPIAGYLISLEVKSGEVIVAGTASFGGGTTLGTVADLSKRRVTVKVSELDYPHLSLGQKAFVTTEAKPGARFSGRVEYIGRMAKENKDRNVRQFDVRVTLDTMDAEAQKVLPPGATVTVEFTLLDVKQVLSLPYECVHTGVGEGAFVWVPAGKDGKEKRSVTLGANNFNRIEISAGLREGDEVLADEDAPGPSAKQARGGSK